MSLEAWVSVRKFHEANTQLINEKAIAVVPFEVRVLRARLMLEELGELAAAIHQENALEIADGLADLHYVVTGTAVSYGHPIQDAWQDADSYPVTGKLSAEKKQAWLHRLASSVSYLVSAIASEAGGKIRGGLAQLTFDINRCAQDYGIPLREVFNEVHASNMTKNLSGATDGKKYGGPDAKGAAYRAPNIAPLLLKNQGGV